MAGITLAQAEAKLTAYLEAETKILSGQSYTFHGRTLTRANLAEIRAGIDTWDMRVKELTAKTTRRRGVVINPGW